MRARVGARRVKRRGVGGSVCAAVTLACGAPSGPADGAADRGAADVARLASASGAVYVLARVEAQAAEPVVTFDHRCADGRRWVSTVRDTVTLWADGTARRAFRLEHLADGVVARSTHIVATGTWAPLARHRNVQYYSDRPSIALTLLTAGAPEGGRYEMLFRRDGAAGLTNIGALGGRCDGGTPGTPGVEDSRRAEFLYSRR